MKKTVSILDQQNPLGERLAEQPDCAEDYCLKHQKTLDVEGELKDEYKDLHLEDFEDPYMYQ